MLSVRHERRDLLTSLAAVAHAGPAVARLRHLEEALGAELDTVAHRPRSSLTWEALRDRYMLGPDVVYLNHASIGTMPRAVHEARVEYMSVCEANPWLYMWGGAWEEPRESVRGKAAALFGWISCARYGGTARRSSPSSSTAPWCRRRTPLRSTA